MSAQTATRAAGARPGPTHDTVARPAEATAAGLLALFVVTLFLPVYGEIAGQRMTPTRLFLLASFVPLLVRLLTGAAGRITAGDILFGLHGIWIGVAIFANNGPSRIPFIGITIAEILGSYLVGRVLVRNIADYRAFFRYFLTGLVLLAPFVLLENLTGRLYLASLFDPIAATHQKLQARAADIRMGLYRAQGVVEHPILWGVFCSIAIANAYYLYRDHRFRRVVTACFCTAMTFTSLSSGPLLSAMLQIGIISWGWITRNAWWLLISLVVGGYVTVDLLSNRTPVQVMISYLTFNPGSGYMRLHIWNYGSAEVLRHPLFGIGLNDWARPEWLASSSVDNFWLLTAMRYGLPGVLLLVAAIVANLVLILRANLTGESEAARTGHVIALISTIAALSTVHVWGSTAVLILFYLGAGCWLFADPAVPVETPAPNDPARARRAMPGDRRSADPQPATLPESLAARRGMPTKEERLARRRAQYSRPRS